MNESLVASFEKNQPGLGQGHPPNARRPPERVSVCIHLLISGRGYAQFYHCPE